MTEELPRAPYAGKHPGDLKPPTAKQKRITNTCLISAVRMESESGILKPLRGTSTHWLLALCATTLASCQTLLKQTPDVFPELHVQWQNRKENDHHASHHRRYPRHRSGRFRRDRGRTHCLSSLRPGQAPGVQPEGAERHLRWRRRHSGLRYPGSQVPPHPPHHRLSGGYARPLQQRQA